MRGDSAVSDERKPRPRRMGIPIVSKKPGSTVSMIELVETERRVLRKTHALDSRHVLRAVGEKLVELLGLCRVVLHEARVKSHHEHVIFRLPGEVDAFEQAVVKPPAHEK